MDKSGVLIGSEIHGFHTMEDLDFPTMIEEAKSRWLRPNEIHAVLSNYKRFTVYVKPMNLPRSGTVVLFDRKMLRNFRKDGHKWKKKKDGKTVKEAHEHLKVGNEERIHVYYAHGEDNPTFVRRCYWLLDKSMEHVVLVHYRETQEVSAATPVNSNSGSAVSEQPASQQLFEEFDSAVARTHYGADMSPLERNDSMTIKNHEQRLHEINTLEWDELLVPDGPQKLNSLQEGNIAGFEFPGQYQANSCRISDDGIISSKVNPDISANSFFGQVTHNNTANHCNPNTIPYQAVGSEMKVNSNSVVSGLEQLNCSQAQDSFGTWMTYAIADSPESVGDQVMQSSMLDGHKSFTYPMVDHHHPPPGQIFKISDISPAWALSTEVTKILIVGSFSEGFLPRADSRLYLTCGDSIIAVELVQAGVFRCLVSSQTPGLVNLYLTIDGHTPISEIMTFEFRNPAKPNNAISYEDKNDWEVFQLQMRLARLLFSSSKGLYLYSTKLSPNALREARAFARKTKHVSESWGELSKMIRDAKIPFSDAKNRLFELTLQNRLHEWLIEKVVAGCKVSERDEQGQGIIHLCAILGYTWAVYPFSWSGLSVDYRDTYGWTALHWAACYGREKMVATLLSVGAKPNLVTDPTPQIPGGCTAADLASKNGYDGLAAYLAEKGLVAQFNDMTLAGNVSGSLQTNSNDIINPGNFTEEELHLKDALAAYRTAADAAARIQTAFREHSLKVRTKAVQSLDPEIEARNIVAAMKIQHAFRNYETRKKMAAAARIQYRFRTWKIRKDFLNMRRQAIKIQAIFRGYQARRQYQKIVWSVGVLEKAILRWRQKRKGFRGLQVQPNEILKEPNQENDVEEDFFQASRKQAEERVERSVVKVQAMFRSKQAQEAYRRMKLEHSKAELEYGGLSNPHVEMG
ncbi:calmodulin-binding transcription activator [Striga asiatica]|uniref:Calmodulin-binding transcription activator n=1 Tax=Striga asiatica TaxID=4170 RepID=A0A5A7R794_STRAF|nr:calmodulin-binding transcription activator [Striga asiatica]